MTPNDRMPPKPIPVILDTDIGSDIDDTWAIAMMLNCPELEPRLILTNNNDTIYRSKLVAKFLTASGRTDVPVGVGKRFKHNPKRARQAKYVQDYDLASYPGTVYDDGVGAMIDMIDAAHEAGEPITLITIGPLENIQEALIRDPQMSSKTAKYVGMVGSVRVGYGGSPEISRECNAGKVIGTKLTFAAGWPEMVITPIDSCGRVQLKGRKYQKVADCQTPMIRDLMENYRIWLAHSGRTDWPVQASSILFDTVAIYLAWTDELLEMEQLPIWIDDEGYTRIDERRGRIINVATGWKDYEAFEDLLVERLTRPSGG